jgi:D-serine deaminase-like pyridoxal phosphate-dependent protein
MNTSSSLQESWPQPDADKLRAQYVGTDIKDLDGPAAILDLAVVKRNCDFMLKMLETLGLGWRAHVKTHKVSSALSYQETCRACRC